MGAQSMTTVLITAECLCKSHSFQTEIIKSKLPLESTACHCDSCRHSTGAFCVIDTTWPQPRENVEISKLSCYRFSANTTYRFCGTCSTLMFYESRRYPSKLGVFTGPLKNIDADLINLTKHIYVEDTIDGGASVWLRRPNADDREIPRYLERDNEIPWDWPETSKRKEEKGDQEQVFLPFWCHCKGLKLLVRWESRDREREEKHPSATHPHPSKAVATFNVFDSSRQTFGTDMLNWIFADLASIFQSDGNAFPKTTAELKTAVDAHGSAVETLAYYEVSPGTQQYFCKVCSASAFKACDDRPEVVGMAIGLLESPGGARAEEYVTWSFSDIGRYKNDVTEGWQHRLMNRMREDAENFRADKE